MVANYDVHSYCIEYINLYIRKTIFLSLNVKLDA